MRPRLPASLDHASRLIVPQYFNEILYQPVRRDAVWPATLLFQQAVARPLRENFGPACCAWSAAHDLRAFVRSGMISFTTLMG